jgi:NSS family neurotransmitter:Na+ symporter
MREKFATRLGFILISAGCAVGLGNVWRFPYMVGQNGGGLFVLIYLVSLALIGLPVLLMELATGRASQRAITGLHAVLTPERRPWRLHGFFGGVGMFVLMMFYTTVTGWMLVYFVRMVSGSLSDCAPAAVEASFSSLLRDPAVSSAGMLVASAVSAGVCAVGLRRGVERVTKTMMLGLLLLIGVLAVHSLTLDGAWEGVRFYLVPDAARMREVGLGRIVVEAVNHAFFTLSIGIGAMSVFGSYLGRERSLLGEATSICLLDTGVALISGMAIIPACFAFGLEPGQGPGLVFVTMPNVFNQMAFGRFWGALFFLFLSVAALTTVITVFEGQLACLSDSFGWSRRRACAMLAVLVPVLSLPCVLGFNLLSSFQPLGEGSSVLDLEDFVVSNVLLPLGGVSFALYCSWRWGWGWKAFVSEVNAGAGRRIPASGAMRFYCGFVLPLVILFIFFWGLVEITAIQ